MVTPAERGLLMRTYDPMSGTIYIWMTHEVEPHTTRITSSRKVNRLPHDYANKSLRTRLRQ
jgi:hypothetical protein